MIQLLWLILGGALAVAAIALRDWIPGLALGAYVGVMVLWLLISVLSPSKPNRTCPRCKAEGLVKIRRGEPGVRCEHCEFVDETMQVAYLDDW